MMAHEVGAFEILERLGAGGMGEVFKARDKRLNRFVAIKFLPETAMVQARERFQREAQAIAALNHANICTLHEVGEDNGRPYLVLELLEGENLRARLRRGALAPEQVLDWGAQIADALDAAHRKGILHRDLKPDNLWVTTGGQIKVLDFGLARLEAEDSSEAPTVDMVLTSPGQTMGTYPYMSPEQARGEALDARSDLFSLGSVLYEMASGRAAFTRASAGATMAAVLKEQPPALEQPELERVVSRLLEKDPDLRYQSASGLRGDLKRMKRASSSGTAVADVSKPRDHRPWWPIAAAVIVIVGGGLVFLRLRAPAPAAAPAELQFRQLTFTANLVAAAISPDGKFLAYTAGSPGGYALHLLSIANGSDVQIVPPGNGCCHALSFSPDGSEVYFMQGSSLRSVPVLGGVTRAIADRVCGGAGFSPDGTDIAYLAHVPGAGAGSPDSLLVARADGSGAHVLHTPVPGSSYTSDCWSGADRPIGSPAWSPNGRWIAVPLSGSQGAHIELVGAANGEAHDLKPTIYPAVDLNWLPDGSGLVFTRGTPSQVWEISVPGGKLTRLTDGLGGYLSVNVAKTGQMVLLHVVPNVSIWAQARAGGAFHQLPGGGATADGQRGLAWTPQDDILSVRNLDGQPQLWLAKSDGGGGHALPVARMPPDFGQPVVAPNGQIIVTAGTATNRIFRIDPDGTGLAPLSPLAANHGASYPTLALGGREVVYDRGGGKPIHPTLWAVPLAGGTASQVWPGEVAHYGNPASPDSNRIFAISSKQGPVIIRLDGKRPQVMRVAFPRGFGEPYGWTPDGRAITYVRRERQGRGENIWAVPITGGKPYAITHFTDLYILAYAFSHDGRLAVSRGSGHGDAVLATGLEKKP